VSSRDPSSRRRSRLSTPPDWLAPTSLEEALELRAEHGDEATVVAGGTFVGVLLNQRLLAPSALLSLNAVPGLDGIESGGELRLGAMATHRSVELSPGVMAGWPALARAFSLVASPRVRAQATVGGVLADADYASDPPAMLCALGARVVACGRGRSREIAIDELITGHYETSLLPDELVTEVRVPTGAERSVYRKFRSRSHEDRPCVAVAAALGRSGLRVVVGAVAERPQLFPEICALAENGLGEDVRLEIARRYADSIDPLSDLRGSSEYRRRVIAVEVRRALEELAA
jgi:carbon-monoxide dehydrogenase medium subunit